MTSAAAGWILAEGHGADGTILDQDVLELPSGTGAHAVHTAGRVATEVVHIQEAAAAVGDRLRLIGVTWRDDATAEAALLLEALTGKGFDNVVPVPLHHAVQTLAEATAAIVGFQRTAVCVLEDEWSTVATVDTTDDEPDTVVEHVGGGLDGLTHWLGAMFDGDAWQPAAVVVIGPVESEAALDYVARQLEEALPVPVFMQTNAPLAIARGAALAAAHSTEFTDLRLMTDIGRRRSTPARSRRASYVGALTGLVAGAVTLVASVSLAVGLRLTPERDSGTPEQVLAPTTVEVAQAQTPAAPPPPAAENALPRVRQAPASPAPAAPPTPAPAAPAVVPKPAPSPEPVVTPPTAVQVTQQEPVSDPGAPAPPPDPGSRPPLLTRLLEHLQGIDPR